MDHELCHTIIDTPIGPLTLVAGANGLREVRFPNGRLVSAADGPDRPDHPVLAQAATQLAEYFAGARQDFDVPLDPHGRTLGLLYEVNDMDEGMMRDERSQALRDALLELSPARRELLTLLLADPPLSYDEISNRLGIPIGSIGPTRARALEQLRNTDAMRALLASATPASEA